MTTTTVLGHSDQPDSYAGSDTARLEVGHPGHCERCVEVGHVLAHPDLGCGDVGCNSGHAEAWNG